MQAAPKFRERGCHKLCQLIKLVEKYESIIYNRKYQLDFLNKDYEERLGEIQTQHDAKSAEIVKLYQSQDKNFEKDVISSYNKQIKKLKKRHTSAYKDKVVEIEGCTKEAMEQLADMLIVVKQLTHNIETSENALRIEYQNTKKYMDDKTKMIRQKYAKEMKINKETFEMKTNELTKKSDYTIYQLIKDHEKEIEALKSQTPKQNKPKINKGKIMIIKDELRNLKEDIAQRREKVMAIIHAYNNHIKEVNEKSKLIVQDMVKFMNQLKQNHEGQSVAFTQLDEQLKMELDNKIEQAKEVFENHKKKLDKMEQDLINAKMQHKKDLEVKTQKIYQRSSDTNIDIFDLIRKNTMQLESLRNEYDRMDEAKAEELDLKKIEMKKIPGQLALELEAIKQERKKEIIEEQKQIEQLKEKFAQEIRELKESFIPDQLRVREEISNSFETVKTRETKAEVELDQLKIEKQQALAEYESKRPKEIEPETVDAVSFEDCDKLKVELDEEYEKAKNKSELEISKAKENLEREMARFEKDNQNSYKIAMNQIEKSFTIGDVNQINNEYRIKLETEQLNLKQIIPASQVNKNQFERTDKRIESLKHQCFQLKSTMKIQRVAFISEWENKVDIENNLFQAKCQAFYDSYQTYKELKDMEEHLKNERQKNQEEIDRFKNDLENLIIESEIIHKDFMNSKLEAMQSKHIEELESNLAELKSELEKSEELKDFPEIKKLSEQIRDETVRIEETKTQLISDSSQLADSFMMEQQRLRTEKAKSLLILCSAIDYQLKLQHAGDEVFTAKFDKIIEDLAKEIRDYSVMNSDFRIQSVREINQTFSQHKVNLDEFQKKCNDRVAIEKSQYIGIRDFLLEKEEVAQTQLEKYKSLFENRPPRDEEAERINILEKDLKFISTQLNALTKDYNLYKKMLITQERVYNTRFGKKPKVGTFARQDMRIRCTLP